MTSARSIAGAAAVPLAFGLAVVVLSASGGGLLGVPPPGDLSGWLERAGPVVAAVAIVRLAALVAAGWMLVASTVRVVAAALGAVRLVAVADRAMPPAVRRACSALAGVGVTGGLLLGAAGTPATGAAPDRPAVERMVRLPATARQHVEPEPDAATASMSAAPAAEAPAPDVPAPDVPAPDDGEGEQWEVVPGDSFWSIAEEVVAERLGRAPTEGEVAAYWGQLIDVNRPRLVTANPDLIFPGQRFVLPG